MEFDFIYKNSTIHYYRFGKGPKIVLGFHGYGLDGSMFKHFDIEENQTYTMYSFDLSFHGKTHIDEKSFDIDFFENFLLHFLEDKEIKTFDLMAYSLGGNFALKALELFPKNVESCCLIAADGLMPNRGRYFITMHHLGISLFEGFIKNPRFFLGLISLSLKLSWISKKMANFMRSQINSKEKRWLLFERWRRVESLNVKYPLVYQKLNQYKTPVNLYFGRYDKLVPARKAKKFVKKVPHARLYVLEAGHNLFTKEFFKKYLLN